MSQHCLIEITGKHKTILFIRRQYDMLDFPNQKIKNIPDEGNVKAQKRNYFVCCFVHFVILPPSPRPHHVRSVQFARNRGWWSVFKMAEGDSIFSKIIRREIPSEFLHEDDQVVQFSS